MTKTNEREHVFSLMIYYAEKRDDAGYYEMVYSKKYEEQREKLNQIDAEIKE